MDSMARILASGRGISQNHYASIQSRIINDIERLTKEYEENKEEYVSCKKCNRVFLKEVLSKEGCCVNCLAQDHQGEEKKDEEMVTIKVLGEQLGECPKCQAGNAMLQRTDPDTLKRVYKCRDCDWQVEWDKVTFEKYKLKVKHGLPSRWVKTYDVGPTPVV